MSGLSLTERGQKRDILIYEFVLLELSEVLRQTMARCLLQVTDNIWEDFGLTAPEAAERHHTAPTEAESRYSCTRCQQKWRGDVLDHTVWLFCHQEAIRLHQQHLLNRRQSHMWSVALCSVP